MIKWVLWNEMYQQRPILSVTQKQVVTVFPLQTLVEHSEKRQGCSNNALNFRNTFTHKTSSAASTPPPDSPPSLSLVVKFYPFSFSCHYFCDSFSLVSSTLNLGSLPCHFFMSVTKPSVKWHHTTPPSQ